jgi:hypothetical protein
MEPQASIGNVAGGAAMHAAFPVDDYWTAVGKQSVFQVEVAMTEGVFIGQAVEQGEESGPAWLVEQGGLC